MTACITADRKIDLDNDLAAVLADITAMNAGIVAFAGTGTKSYTIDSGTGRAQQVFHSPIEMITARDRLIAQRNFLRRALNGTSILRTQTRR